MSLTPSVHQLAVPGARLHYEVRGAGPLLLIVGQPMTSEPFAPLADLLATDHTVLTYDPRGLGASTVEDPTVPVTPEVEADDLAALVEAVGTGPADVFGSSGGAVAGLALVTRHPDLVRTLVAHEPPVTDLLEDGPHVRAAVDQVEQAFVNHGSGAAWGGFVSLVMHHGPVGATGVPPATWTPPAGADDAPPPAAPTPDELARQQAGDALFFLRMLKPFTRYDPDLAALGAARVVVGVGETSDGEVAVRSALALAGRLGLEPFPFPGEHGGFMSDPGTFAERLRTAFAG